MVQVRNIQQKDKNQWVNQFKQYIEFYESKIADENIEVLWNRFFDDNEQTYAAVATEDNDDNKLLGFVTWIYHRHTWMIPQVIYLHDLFVDPAVRLKGTGRALIDYVKQQAIDDRASKVYWHTQHFNHRAQLLYTKVATKSDFVSYSWTPPS